MHINNMKFDDENVASMGPMQMHQTHLQPIQLNSNFLRTIGKQIQNKL